MSYLLHLLNIKKREGDGFPEVVAVLAGDFEVFIQFLFDERVVLHRDCVPHQVLLWTMPGYIKTL